MALRNGDTYLRVIDGYRPSRELSIENCQSARLHTRIRCFTHNKLTILFVESSKRARIEETFARGNARREIISLDDGVVGRPKFEDDDVADGGGDAVWDIGVGICLWTDLNRMYRML